MRFFLLAIPLFAAILGILIYRFQDGKREVFKLDLVQFFYLFILTPTIYVWLKSFLFYLLRRESELSLSTTQLFIVDTAFSMISFIIFVAIAIHSLTKTFWVKRYYDPHFDIYHLSEYFHLWWSHVVIFIGGMLLACFASLANIVVPFPVGTSKPQFYGVLLLGVISGVITFFIVWMSDPKQGNFMRLMKIFFGLFFLLHVIVYFLIDPAFNMSYGSYWFVLTAFFTMVVASSFFERYEQTNRLRNLLLHVGWGNNIKIQFLDKKHTKK